MCCTFGKVPKCLSQKTVSFRRETCELFELKYTRKASNLAKGIELRSVFTYVRHGIIKDLREGFVESHGSHIEASTVEK